jgi:Tfp pilus assembly protein FimT
MDWGQEWTSLMWMYDVGWLAPAATQAERSERTLSGDPLWSVRPHGLSLRQTSHLASRLSFLLHQSNTTAVKSRVKPRNLCHDLCRAQRLRSPDLPQSCACTTYESVHCSRSELFRVSPSFTSLVYLSYAKRRPRTECPLLASTWCGWLMGMDESAESRVP